MQFYGINLVFLLFLVACSSSQNSVVQVFPSRFYLDVSKDILETLDGNTFVAHVKGVNPIFGRALKIKARGLQVESVSDTNASKVSTAFRQWHQFRQPKVLRAGVARFWAFRAIQSGRRRVFSCKSENGKTILCPK